MSSTSHKPHDRVVQIANTSHGLIHLKRNTLLGHICPVTAVSNQTISTITDGKISADTRAELQKAFQEAFKDTMLVLVWYFVSKRQFGPRVRYNFEA